MDNNDYKDILKNSSRKKQLALKSINNYLLQLKLHYELTDLELYDIIKNITGDYKNIISSKKWWWKFL